MSNALLVDHWISGLAVWAALGLVTWGGYRRLIRPAIAAAMAAGLLALMHG